jgi:protein-tyrosine phosphatase
MTIDLHFHLLPGLDDGPATTDAAVELARAAVAAGTDTIVATPHVSWRYPNDARTIRQAAESLRTRLRDLDTSLELLSGAEIAMTRVGDLTPAELAELAIDRGPWLLLEPPFTASWAGLDNIVQRLQLSGHRILLAHPERCLAFRRDPRALEALVDEGVLTSITAGSLVGDFGEEIRVFSLALVRDGLAHSVASDSHDLHKRPPEIVAKLSEAGLKALADWLTDGVPRAILANTEIPPRPSVPTVLAPARPRTRRGLHVRRFRRAS